MTGLACVDHWIGRGDLQDAENCGYLPASALAEMGVDDSLKPALWQFENGRIQLLSGAVLQTGGTFGMVWGCVELPHRECSNALSLTPYCKKRHHRLD
jgi:hypothetical protein